MSSPHEFFAREDILTSETMQKLVHGLTEQFGEVPEENEIIAYVMGTEEERDAIWNSRKDRHGREA